ncbi:MAG: leucine-rich repeat domain-containing protein [Lachnospiraceae bacterium]|nr:leucine-rich repeat domain-containing protein [Lachnospiraceae bacterium]
MTVMNRRRITPKQSLNPTKKMKKLFFWTALFFFLLPYARAQVQVNEANFPDGYFREYVANYADKDGDGNLTIEEIKACTFINLQAAKIKDVKSLKGIEYFTDLDSLDCSRCKITTLTLRNKNLKYINCSSNWQETDISDQRWGITSIDVDECTQLEYLDCSGNSLRVVKIANPSLKTLICRNQSKFIETSIYVAGYLREQFRDWYTLESLDIDKCTNLERLDCSGNVARESSHFVFGQGSTVYTRCLTSVSIHLPNLKSFVFSSNRLSAMNLSECTNLPELDISKTEIKNLNVSGCTGLQTLKCSTGHLVDLNTSGCVGLQTLNCSNNKLTDLDIDECINLETLDCKNNRLSNLDISKCSNLKTLDCSNNGHASLQLSHPSLKVLKCTVENDLDVRQCPMLEELYCSSTAVKRLNVSGNTALKILEFRSDSLASLNVNHLAQLEKLFIASSKNMRLEAVDCTKLKDISFPSIDFHFFNASGCTSLNSINESGSKVSVDTLILRGCTSLRELNVSGNITLLDLSDCPDLYWWKGSESKYLPSHVDTLKIQEGGPGSVNLKFRVNNLDLQNNKDIQDLRCSGWSVKFLNVNGCTNLETLRCSGTLLKSVEVQDCPKIKYLDCSRLGGLDSIDISGCSLLEKFFCEHTNLNDLDLSQCTNLEELSCGNTNIEVLDLSACHSLKKLSCSNTGIKNLDLKNCLELRDLSCENTNLTRLDVSPCSLLESLRLRNNSGLSFLNASGCEALSSLNQYGQDNSYPILADTLILNGCTSLEEFNLTGNDMKYMDISGCTALRSFYEPQSICTLRMVNTWERIALTFPIQHLDMRGSDKTTYLQCSGLGITSIDLDGCSALETIDCSSNQISKLNVKNFKSLKYLNASKNHMTSLNVVGCSTLEWLNCSDNDLPRLDVSGNKELKELYCYNNRILDLNVGESLNLQTLECSNNRLASLDLVWNSALGKLSCLNSRREVKSSVGATFDLSTLKDFDVKRVVNLRGGTLKGSILTFNGEEVNYMYATLYSGASSIPATVAFTLVANPDMVDEPDSDPDPDLANEIQNQNTMKVYPNPTNCEFTIELSDKANIDIFDALGRLVRQEKQTAGTHKFSLTKSGLYFVKITIKEEAFSVSRLVVL